jgi:hypothetical protein
MNGHSAGSKIYRILSLDGGGAKGFYTLGALKEVEALVRCRLFETFDLIYGTSTGGIIAALLGLGKSVDEIEVLYRRHVVSVMARWLPGQRTAALEALSAQVFGDLKFDAFKTGIGIVGTRWTEERPIIFKTDERQAFLLERPEVGEQTTNNGLSPKDDGDKCAVNGPTAQGSLPRRGDCPHPRQIHATRDGDRHARSRPGEARPALAARARLRARR